MEEGRKEGSKEGRKKEKGSSTKLIKKKLIKIDRIRRYVRCLFCTFVPIVYP